MGTQRFVWRPRRTGFPFVVSRSGSHFLCSFDVLVTSFKTTTTTTTAAAATTTATHSVKSLVVSLIHARDLLVSKRRQPCQLTSQKAAKQSYSSFANSRVWPYYHTISNIKKASSLCHLQERTKQHSQQKQANPKSPILLL